MNKRNAIIIAFGSAVLSICCFTGMTFAWISYNQIITGVNVESGQISMTASPISIYRYNYPTFEGSTLIDYSKEGTVSSYNLTTEAHTYSMNKLDPTYILISSGTGVQTQDGIESLNTNIVLKVSFSVTYSAPIKVRLSLDQDTSYTPSIIDSVQHYGISDYLNFISLSQAELTALSTPSGVSGEPDLTFYKAKAYAKANPTLRNTVATSADTADLFSYSVTDRPASETTTAFVFYVNLDYDVTKCADFFKPSNLGIDYVLDSDYSLTLHAEQIV